MGLYADAKSIAKRDPAAKGVFQVLFLYPGFHILIYHKLAHWLYGHHRYILARMISQIGRFWTGIEIHPGAKIADGLFIDHGSGVVIGETAVVGRDCTIYHGVTLGGTGKDKGKKRHPTIGECVLIGAGAKILGPINIGDNVLVGANSVVLHDVPDEATIVGVPGRVVRHQGKKHIHHNTELDHASAPDPLEQQLCRLMKRVAALEKELTGAAGTDCAVKNGDVVKTGYKDNNESSN